jgi:hypothetical protein
MDDLFSRHGRRIKAGTVALGLLAVACHFSFEAKGRLPAGVERLTAGEGGAVGAGASVPLLGELTVARGHGGRKVTDLLVDAIIQVESGGRPRKVGTSGERGIMQIKRDTWRHVTRRICGKPVSFDLAFDAWLNQRVGRAYLAELQVFLAANRRHWRADERSLLLACYNAGPTRVLKANFDVRRLPASTRSYVERASALHEWYLENGDPAASRLLVASRGLAQPASAGS